MIKTIKIMGRKRFQGNCNYCGKFRHKEADCQKRTADAKNNNRETAATAVSDGNHIEFLLCTKDEVGSMTAGTTTNQIFPNSHKLLMQPSIFIGDTVAMMDMTPHDIGMVNKQAAKESVSIIKGNKQVEKSIAIRDIPSMICDNQGVQIVKATMKGVAFVLDCTFNLFSISKWLKQGWKLGGNNNTLVLTSPDGNSQIKFDIKISTPNGFLYAMCIKCMQEEVVGVVTTNHESKMEVKMMLMQAQEKLGHINECATKEILKALGWELTNMRVLHCASCAGGTAKQKLLKKVNFVEPGDEKDGYRAYLDLSTIKQNKKYPAPTNLNWQILVVEMKLQLKFSHFYKSKNAMVEPTCELMHCWQQAGKIISKLRMDNAGENKKLVLRLQSADWKNPVVIESTARDTPQQN